MKYLKHIPLVLFLVAIISIPTLLYTVNLLIDWPIEQTALSQFGYYPATKFAFGTILVISGTLLLLYGMYLVDHYSVLRNSLTGILFSIVYFSSFIGMILAGIFPMETPAVFTLIPDPLTIHFVASLVLILGFPLSMILFGISVKMKYRILGVVSIITGLGIYAFFVPFFAIPTAQSSMLLELWSIILGLIWLNLTAYGTNCKTTSPRNIKSTPTV